MIIKVKRRHIKNGLKGCPKRCAVALALEEQTGRKFIVAETVVKDLGFNLAGDLPRSAKVFIREFDVGRKVKPFNFRIKLAALSATVNKEG